MSVICQNFVQNTWKKDLCSNCFKSVGDHETSEGQISKISDKVNGKYAESQKNETAPAHTTWKSLISEKNCKNTQPFKLENGFQGRLLTINKALNGTDKPNTNDSNSKDLSKYATFSNKLSNKVNTEHKSTTTTDSSHLKKKQGNTNGYIIKSENVTNGKCSDRKTFNRNTIKTENSVTMTKQNKSLQEDCKTENISNQKNKTTENKNSETIQKSPNLHSILKKTKSNPPEGICQSRRSSNVGFKDEEPLVIGYGGRDFAPEELEWEMASSDGETENACDSLDETEDDKVFSKMTKQNTEFNSDNANLLQNKEARKNGDNSTNCNSEVKLQKNFKKKSNTSEEITDNQNGCKESKVDSNSDLVMNNKVSDIEKETDGESKNCDKVINDAVKIAKGIIQTNNSDNVKIDAIPTTGGNELTTEDSEIKNMSDSINVAIKGDNTCQTTKEVADSVVEDKNNSEFINGTQSPILNAGARKKTERGRTTDEVMFSGREEQTWQEKTEDGDGIAGEILQAINTSLTNRHKMRENPEMDTAEGEEEPNSQNEVNKVFLSFDDGKSGICNNTEQNEENSNEVQEENTFNVTPRESFLHGTSKPNAIYGPASDLFVSRSNSSSSSSSDEMSKSQISLSINVIVNGDDCSNSNQSENYNLKTKEYVGKTFKTKPDIPAKPIKQGLIKTNKNDDSSLNSNAEKNNEDALAYYSPIPDHSKTTIDLVEPYAESNIYQEVNDTNFIKDNEPVSKAPGRETKLAALAMELEQARHSSTNTKRQAPAPPKIPDPPFEDPPSCAEKTSPIPETHRNFSTFRGEAMEFSSASSTTSTSSQDTETGYASWNLHGDTQDQPKHKSKSSFLLTQYSKCKMLAMNYAEDSVKARKRFSIKKLLKIGKETEAPATFDPNCPNPKAWKYSDHFERPRAKLEIIHPMDLENKSVTVNPGFDAMQSRSMRSFSTSLDESSFRNSISSDYGSYYSDTLSPSSQDHKQDTNYDYIHPHLSAAEQEDSFKTGTSNSNSPTPSRSSTASQASTVTSGSSKNAVPPHRPPKPPPPPRAHSLLPNNRNRKNSDGTYKFPAISGDTSSSDEVTIAHSKPQAPKRQSKSSFVRTDYANLDEQVSVHVTQQDISPSKPDVEQDINQETGSKTTSSIHITLSENPSTYNQQDDNDMVFESKDIELSSSQELEINKSAISSSNTPNETMYNTVSEDNGNKFETSITIKTNSHEKEKVKPMLSRNKHPPYTKSPARPPPIYSKPQSGNFSKNTQPWKTLEDSYQALTSSNRELLIKLVNQALKKRKHLVSSISRHQFQWADFEIDTSEPSSIFAFGEKIAYQAIMPALPEYELTLVISIQQQQHNVQENTEIKYPLYGRFVDYIPNEILDNSTEELENIPATILVLDRSTISTIECFSENLPETLSEENERELCFIILQLIQALKSLQAQGIESMDSNFQNLLLAKSKQDKYHTLIFLYDICYDENEYTPDSCKISLCQYTLMLLFQMLKIQSMDESVLVSKFSSHMPRKIFETAFSLLSEEKAVSLSQTKTLFECYLWGVTKVLQNLQDCDDCDSVLHRWLDIERCNCMKSIIGDEVSVDLNVQNEYYSQFLIRTNVRNIKEISLLL